MFQTQALITEVNILGPGYYELQLMAAEIAAVARPGQFVQLRVAEPDTWDPLLSRPISLYRIDPASGCISVVFKVVGRGTTLLAAKQTGELIEIIGPIGNGFTIPETTGRLALIAGGIGMPPLFCLAEVLCQTRPELEMVLFYGGQSSRDILALEAWEALQVKVNVATDDGTQGAACLVTELFLNAQQQNKFEYLAACGPKGMLKAVRRLAIEQQINGEISLEANMACGVGACLGCTCQTNSGYQRVCLDGPVFNLREVEL